MVLVQLTADVEQHVQTVPSVAWKQTALQVVVTKEVLECLWVTLAILVPVKIMEKQRLCITQLSVNEVY
jgi:hypothetical protein